MFRMISMFVVVFCGCCYALDADLLPALKENAEAASEAIIFSHRYANAWLAHADPETGLLPRNLTGDLFWNAKDAAADNYPFLALTGEITGLHHLRRAALHILEQEQHLAVRTGALPDTYCFRTRGFLTEQANLSDLIFGASEYIKDGLMPIVEWIGPGPWMDRMQSLAHALYEEAEKALPSGKAPSKDIEVCGELMQSMSRLYWRTGDARYKERCFRLADRYLLERPVTGLERIRLRDHGCEIIGGLSEVYLMAAREDAPRHVRYRPAMHALLDLILEKGVNEDGMMPDWFDPRTGEQDWRRISDGWGYVYNAFLTVADVDGIDRYRDAATHALDNIHKYLGANWEGGSADGYADSVEGALNLLNRLPVATAFEWVDQSMWHIFAKQRADGVIEGWHGDGNSARTALLYALWKTQGVAVNPWRDDVRLGAVLDEDGALHLYLQAEWAWRGHVKVDRPRHRDYLGLPVDYPRINQFPEWFVVDAEEEYDLTVAGAAPRRIDGRTLWNLPLELEPGQAIRMVIRPVTSELTHAVAPPSPFRRMGYETRGGQSVDEWQAALRQALAVVLRIDLASSARAGLPLHAEVQHLEEKRDYLRHDIMLQVADDRRIPAILTLPRNAGPGPFPAVVCIHGHGSDRHTVYDTATVYHGFAEALAGAGAVTIAVDVGQHEIQRPGATLMGERMWDLLRTVDYLESLPEVDARRIGCAGLSLGGEMVMWLGALDTRIRASVSAGFLTVMNQMERNHCRCWLEEGLRELADFPDIYALIAPRALLCQIGREEPLSQFNTVIAERAFTHLHRVYEDLDATDKAQLTLHPGGHEIHLSTLMAFLFGAL